jgi:predicted nicotinamide N-methyase
VLDLGSGVGLLGLCCAALGARVILSDFAMAVLALLQANVDANAESLRGTCHVVRFDWRQSFPLDALELEGLCPSSLRRQQSGCPTSRASGAVFDHIVASDVLFSEQLVPVGDRLFDPSVYYSIIC